MEEEEEPEDEVEDESWSSKAVSGAVEASNALSSMDALSIELLANDKGSTSGTKKDKGSSIVLESCCLSWAGRSSGK